MLNPKPTVEPTQNSLTWVIFFMFKRWIYQGSIWFHFLRPSQSHIIGAQDTFDKEIFKFGGIPFVLEQIVFPRNHPPSRI